MADYGAKFADKKIRKVDRQLQAVYRQAERELKKKLADFVRKSSARDAYKRKQLAAGVISEKEYQDWLRGQVFQKKAWENRIEQVQKVMYNHDVEAAKIVHENSLDVYDENYLYSAFQTEQITGVSFHLQDTAAVSKLIKDRDQLLPEWKIDEEKDYQWCYRKVNNAVVQGLIQGEGVDKIMNRLATDLCSQDEKRMRLFARTAITNAQTAGLQQEMEDAAERFDIEQHKLWRAILDSRTRDAHRHLDGQEVPYNEPFKSDLGDIMRPGDPEADPANVYNCRCGMIVVYPKYRNVVNNNVRRAYGEYTDEKGNQHRYSYLTADPEAYTAWKNPVKKAIAKNEGGGTEKESIQPEYNTIKEYDTEILRIEDLLENWDDSNFDTYAESFEEHEKMKQRIEQLKEQKMLLPYPDDEVMKGIKKTKETGYLETAKATNPNYSKSPKYTKNCSCCVVANEMRARGYDVIAKTAESNMRYFWFDTDKHKGEGSWCDCFDGIKYVNVGAKRKPQQISNITKIMEDYGEGARAVVFVEWDRGGGHYFTVQNVKGKIKFTNPQNQDEDAYEYFDYSRPSQTALFRIDNLKATDYVRELVEENKGGETK